MTDESPRDRIINAGYVPALWLAPDVRFLPPGGPPRTVSLEEAIAGRGRREGPRVTWSINLRDRSDDPADQSPVAGGAA